MKYLVQIKNKKSREVLGTTTVDSTNDIGICLKGEIQLLSIIRFDKRNHSIGFQKID